MDEAGGPVAMAAPATEPPAAPAAPLRIFKTGQRLEDDQPAAAGAAAVETPAESNVVIEFQGRTDGPPVAAEADTHPGVSRKGETLEKFLRGIEDPEEKRLVERLKDLLDGPKPSWDEVKAAWRDILNKGPETAKRLVPLILNR